jgi:hypothetical protein
MLRLADDYDRRAEDAKNLFGAVREAAAQRII